MVGFVLRRVGAALIVIFLASVLVFAGVRALPGDPAIALGGENRDAAVLADIRHKYGLDEPLVVQYARWAWLALHGDLGVDSRQLAVAHDDRDTAAHHHRAGRARDPVRNRDRDARGSDRGSPPREGLGLRLDDGRARRALVAALLARPAADHPLRRQPRMAAGRRVRAVPRRPDREPAAHAASGARARLRALGGADAADALGDARLHSLPTTSGRRVRRVCPSPESSACTRSGTA